MKKRIAVTGIAGGLAGALLWIGLVQNRQEPQSSAVQLDRSAGIPVGSIPDVGGMITTNRVAPSSVYRPAVLAERQNVLPDGTVQYERLVRKEGKYPNRLVVETLRKDRQLRKFVPVGRTEMVADHVLVSLKDGASADALEKLANQFGAAVVRPLSDGRTFVVQLEAPTLDAVDEAIGFFSKASAKIAYAEPDYVRQLSKLPNDLMYGDLWGMPKVSAPAAWDVETGTSSVVVAIIDTGMDMDHPDLLPNLWNNPGEISGDGLDNDGNGFVDDVNGWDFVTEDKDPDDGDGHGTHTAGTVGAVGNNANQVVGVCWKVSLMPVRAGTEQGLTDSDIVDSIHYAANNGAKVLSNSYGGPGFSQTMYDAVEYANQCGAIFVAAAGNDSSDNDLLPFYPASYDLPNVISVAATDQNDALADFSNYGKNSVDLAAPGVDIVSTYLNGETKSLQGTSMACPMVAGAVALYASYDPDVAPAAAKQLVMDSVDPVVGLQGKVVSGGRLNVQAMFANADDTDKDGMPDTWETEHGLDPNDPADADLDGDNDFLTNLQEFKNGTDPAKADTDGDSLVDGWEVRYGFNPLSVHGTLPRLQYLGLNVDSKDAYGVALQGGYAYVADGAFGLKILDLSNPENPKLAGSYATGGFARGVAVDGSMAYVADSENGLFIIDVSIPTNPVFQASLEIPCTQVAVDGANAYLAAGTNGLRVVDVSSPTAPVETASFDGNGDPAFKVNDVALAGGSVYMALDGGLGQISTSANPATYSVKVVSDQQGNKNCSAVFYNGSELYVALENYGVLVYDLAKNLLGGAETPGSAVDVFQSEGLIYVADGSMGLQILAGTNLASIVPYESYRNVRAYGVSVANGYAYTAGKTAGLQIFRSSVDSDSDGMYDGWEMKYFGSLDQTYTNDFDSDGIINWGEYLADLDPTNSDQDVDGLIDGTDEVQTYNTDPRTDDTDGDGLGDFVEITTHGTDPLLADTDGDGMTDGWEIEHGLNPLVDDGTLDADSDGASNRDEELAGTDPSNPDTDGDGMSDGWEIDMGLNPLENDAAEDPDGDLLTNLQEFGYDTNPLKADSDDDGISDPDEIDVYGTDPTNSDSDGDGMADGWEIGHGLDPLDATGDNGADGDMDHDGLSNFEEFLNGSDPHLADTDSDGFTDAWERDWGTQATNAADPVVVDDDAPLDSPTNAPYFGNGGMPQDPQLSDTNENGSVAHPFDAIQEAINVASNGFTVLVKEGQYYGAGNRDINLGEKQLRILAENQADPSKTVVKSHGLSVVFVFAGGQNTNTVLSGFTIQSSMVGIDCSNGDCGEMNGIVCKDASGPTISNCVVEICRDDAIYCEFASDPVISNVTIRTIYEGHGIRAKESTPMIVDCTITNISLGSGIYATDSDGLEIVNSVVDDVAGRGVWVVNDANAKIINTTISDCWGGVRCENSSPMIDRCTISGNEAPDYYTQNNILWKTTHNIAEEAENPDLDMTDVRNDDENGGGILLLSGSFPTIQNCVIANNRTWASDPDYSKGNALKPYYGLGGGLFVGENCASRTINCTIADNLAMTLGGGITTYGNFVEFLRNDVLWGNACSNAWLDTAVDPAVLMTPGAPHFNALHCNEGTSHFDPWYCNIQDGYGFVGDRYNFEADPAFAGGGDYHLTGISTNIDKGSNYEVPLYDRDGILRPLDGDNDGTASVDIGAYEYVNPSYDADSDSDGMPDGWEVANGLDPFEDDAAADPDGDTLSNLAEYSLLTSGTYLGSTNPQKADSDGDGLTDAEEVDSALNTNPNSSDTDGDGMTDGWEVQYGLNPLADDSVGDADGDGLSNLGEFTNGTDPNNPDTDADGMPDGWEIDHGLNPLLDDGAADADGDGLSNLGEFTNGTDPNNPDTDGDSMADGWEVTYGLNPVLDDAAADADSDGLSNLGEYQAGTDPNNPDTDADGMPDGWEVDHGFNPLVDDGAADADADGLSNLGELTNGTDPNNPDTDGDGMADGWEVQYGLNPLVPNASDADSDGDGLTDLLEFAFGSSPLLVDTDGDGFDDSWEYAHQTRPADAHDPLVVDDNAPGDPEPYNPQISDPNEDGSMSHPFDAIQEAIDAAASAGLVWVLEGYYIDQGNMNIDPKGKALRIYAASTNVADTVVDADGLGVCFLFQSGEDTNTIVKGFSLTSPKGSCNAGDCEYENGILCRDGSRPLIRDCVIVDCELAGVRCESGSSPVLENLDISGCGTGVEAHDGSSPQLKGVQILQSGGSGIVAENSDGLLISESVVSNSVDRGIRVKGDTGCRILDSVVSDCAGGLVFTNSRVFMDRCMVWDNITTTENGAGILLENGAVLNLQNALVLSNRASNALGGGLYIDEGCVATNINCTYAENESTAGGAIASIGGNINAIRNTIFWGNRADSPECSSLYCQTGAFDVKYSDVEHGGDYVSPYKYVIEENPHFSTTYELMNGSSCIDVGTLVGAPTNDLAGTPRPLDGDADGTARVDFGAYEYVYLPLNGDEDGDGMPNGWEMDHNLDPFVDDAAEDADLDNLANLAEYQAGTDPNNPDTDGDGMTDGWEVDYGFNPLLDDGAADADGDGLSNLGEFTNGTDPNNSDTDGDGMTDGWEIGHGLNPLVDDGAADADGDGLSNLGEFTNGTDPNNTDTDGDGMTDGWEVNSGLDPLADDTVGDADGDGLSNYEESLIGSDPSKADTDSDGFADGWERDWGTQATNQWDPVWVDDDHSSDPAPYDPMISSTNENGTLLFPFDAIQEAIDSSNTVDGMTVIVTNGYYIGQGNMNIDTKGKAITIMAYSSNVADTIIDADGLGSAFLFQSGETTNTVIRGFAITTPAGNCGDGDCGYEHGIVCKDGSSPFVADCVIFDCALSGVDCSDGSNPIISNTVITACGDGVYCRTGSSPLVIDSVVENSHERIADGTAHGMGIIAIDASGLTVKRTIIQDCHDRGVWVVNDPCASFENCRVEDNLGGFRFQNSKVVLDACRIEGNIAPDHYTQDGSEYMSLTNIAEYAANTNIVADVTDNNENGGGILLLSGSVLSMKNSVLAQNKAVALDPAYDPDILDSVPEYGLGGGLYIGENCYVTNMNCTYGDNEARRGGGISSLGTHSDYIRNTVLWGNSSDDQWIEPVTYSVTNIEAGVTNVEENTVNELMVDPKSEFSSLHCRHGAFNVWYCDVEHGGGYVNPYKHVFEEAPQFVSNYAVAGTSPCIDEGTAYLAPSCDLDGIARPLDGDNNGVAKHDLGAYEYVNALADSDSDSLLDQAEIDAGTNPANADTDSDGMSDGFEVQYGFNATAADGTAAADADGDGLSNLDEDVAGTDPVDPLSYFYVSAIQPLAGGGVELSFDTVAGRVYTVRYSTGLGGEWLVLQGGIAGTGSPVAVQDTLNDAQCFYRVEVARP